VKRRDPARQPDLRSVPATDPLRRHTSRRLFGAMLGDERRGLAGLRGGGLGLDFLEQPDPVDPFRVADVLLQTGEHVPHQGQRRGAHRHRTGLLDVPRHAYEPNRMK
jgi:hypothetical protein